MSSTELFRQKFDPETFAKYCRENLTENFVTDSEDLQITGHKLFQKVELIGSDTGINDLKILIVELKNPNDPRITLTKKIFELMKARGYEKTLVAFWHPESSIWRLSLVSLNYGIDEKGKVTKLYSNPKRYSYTLGEGVQTLKTADKYLTTKFNSWEELLAGFSITALNKEFYDEIEILYMVMHDKILTHNPGLFSIDQSKDFALKLLGRLIFCWFLRAKGWVSDDVLSSRIIASFGDSDNYYDRVLEALFFETLNKPADDRKYDFVLESGYPAIVESLTKVPYLNGGLFDPKLEDHKGRVNKVENKILLDLIYLFEQYHFTVDESTSSDVELGIDPEMMGRVFENFILDRSTKGAFYTPREIVDYMVESSILESVRGFTKFENLNIDSLKKTINLDDYDYTNTLIQYPRRTLITTLDILQDVEISLYTIAKIRGWKLVEEDKFGKFPHRHKEITDRVWSRLLDTEFEIKNVFWAKSKEVKLHRDKQELTKLPKLGAIIKIDELEYVVIFSVYFDPASSRSRLIIDTIYGVHGTKTDKLIRQSTANHTELVEFLDKKNIPTEGIKSIVDGLPVLDGYYQRILAERQLSEIFTVLQATYSSIIPKPKNSVNTYSGSKIQVHVTNVLDNTPKLKHQKKTQSIIDNLHNLQILDPACGSGAFPMGVLQKLVDITHELAPLQSIYDIKLKILKSCIYGVDIMPIAVEISRLRCWLSLVVDQDNDATKAQLLPNLEFNFVCANSLVGIQKGSAEYLYDPLVESTKLELDKIRQLTFEPGHNKAELEQKWKTASYALSLAMASGYRDQSYELINSWNPFQNHSSAFFDPMWMFGIESFDLVIGNPPYVGEKGNKDTFEILKQSELGKRFYQGKMDLFYFFFHLAIDNLQSGGIMSFITTNYFITATGGVKLRKDMQERSNVIDLINFGELKIFKSALGQHNMITLLQKKYKTPMSLASEADEILSKPARTIITHNKGYLGENILIDIVQGADSNTNYYQIPQDQLYKGGNISMTSGGLDEVLDKVKNNSKDLGEICAVNNGLRTGIDKISGNHLKYSKTLEIGSSVFIINKDEVKSLEDEKTLIKNLYKNSDINKFVTENETNLSVIYTKKETVISNFPKIKSHLERFKNLIEEIRKNDGEIWYSIVRPRKQEIFDLPKIVAPQRSKTNTFGYNEIPWYASADVYFITQPTGDYSLKFLLGILNSRIIYKWLYNRGKRKGEMLELYQEPLSKIPIPVLDTPHKVVLAGQIEALVEEILAAKNANVDIDNETRTPTLRTPTRDVPTEELEARIDVLVYQLYELTPEEITLVS